ncbi:MAG: hypothetical protein CMH67_04035 [Nisaea sp.]|nr:hypothetical protein [Nisaea sp.]OUX97353.1 MAG: hypothetical protein CBB86_04145 [Candidatus Endolissoclinum sp. TMED26]
MITAFSRAVTQMFDPSLRNLVLVSVAASIVLLGCLVMAIWLALDSLALFDIGWLNSSIEWLGKLALVLFSWMLFPSTTQLVTGFLLDKVARRVEAVYYPDLGSPNAQPLTETLTAAVKFLLTAVALNVLALPLYITLTVFSPVIFYALNGYLLGREYFEMVASRRLDANGVVRLKKAHGLQIWITGAVLVFLMTVPIINLLTPVVATAAMLHIFEKLRARAGLSG